MSPNLSKLRSRGFSRLFPSTFATKIDALDDLDSLKENSTRIERPTSPPPEYPEDENECPKFHLFSALPTELRMRIWEYTLKPRIIKRIRKGLVLEFDTPSNSLPLLSVSREARSAAFLYGKYQSLVLNRRSSRIYFSPVFDYLFFDPEWGRESTETEFSVTEQAAVRKLLVHPNWNGAPLPPKVLFAQLPFVEQILVAADEKSIGLHSRTMLGTVQDIKKQYRIIAQKASDHPIDVPHIAVGCLGWIGEERRALKHGSEDRRQLIAIFENDAEMKAHLSLSMNEAWRFTQERFNRPRIALKLHRIRTGEGLDGLESPSVSVSPHKLPERQHTAVICAPQVLTVGAPDHDFLPEKQHRDNTGKYSWGVLLKKFRTSKTQKTTAP